MYIETDYNYGADADGNRGITVKYLEFEDSETETEEIRDILRDKFFEYGEVTNGCTTLDITLDGYEFEDIEIEILEYFTENELNDIQKEIDLEIG